MGRLTSNADDISYLCNYLNRHSNFDGNRFKAIYKKLAEYEDMGMTPDEIYKVIKEGVPEWIPIYLEYRELEEQGLLIKLPCKAGDIVYVVRWDIKAIEEGEILSFTKYKHVMTINIILGRERRTEISAIYFNKSVFLTREEAKKALEESD